MSPATSTPLRFPQSCLLIQLYRCGARSQRYLQAELSNTLLNESPAIFAMLSEGITSSAGRRFPSTGLRRSIPAPTVRHVPLFFAAELPWCRDAAVVLRAPRVCLDRPRFPLEFSRLAPGAKRAARSAAR